MIELSIIVISWNAKEYLRNCLNSLKERQGGCRHEIIVVDNGSIDGSLEMVRQDFSAVTLIQNQHNLGFSKANNQGIKISQGRYLAFVNSDVVVLDDCLDKMRSFMDNHPEIGMLGPRVLNADRSLQP